MLGGDSPGLDICISEAACALFANPPVTPPPPPTPVPLSLGGMQVLHGEINGRTLPFEP
eukprot:SAG22_NODE_406_length_10984_cov_28.344970_16_plen_59_part_00